MDIPITTVAAFAVMALLIEVTPGPNMVYLAVLTLGEGRRAGFAAVAGVALGLLTIGMISAFGFGALALEIPALYQAMRWGGVAYLLWLAWDGWHAARSPVRSTPAGNSHRQYFLRGLITNMLNPKAGIFYVTLLPNFVDASRPIIPQAVVLSGFYVVIATGIHTLLVLLAGMALPLLQGDRREMFIRRALSLSLVAVACWLAWSTR